MIIVYCVILVVGVLLLAILLVSLINYYSELFSQVGGSYKIKCKKDFLIALIPYKLWVEDFINDFKDLK